MEGEGIDGDVQKKYPFREKFQYHCKHYFKHSFTVHSETEYFTWKTPFFFSSNSSLPDSRKKKAIPTLTFPVYISRIFFPKPWSLWMCFRPWTWKHVGCMTCESLSHLREWLYPQGTKCGKKTLSSCGNMGRSLPDSFRPGKRLVQPKAFLVFPTQFFQFFSW